MIKEFKKQTIGYMMGAFGLVAALAWNDAIKALIDNFFESPGDDIIARFIYAVIITVIVVVVTWQLTRWTGTEEDNKK